MWRARSLKAIAKIASVGMSRQVVATAVEVLGYMFACGMVVRKASDCVMRTANWEGSEKTSRYSTTSGPTPSLVPGFQVLVIVEAPHTLLLFKLLGHRTEF